MPSKQYQFNFDDVPIHGNIVLLEDPRWLETLEKFKNSNVFGIDIETYGEGLDPIRGQIRLISIGLLSGEALIADLGGYRTGDKSSLYGEFFSILRSHLPNKNIIKIGQNLYFEQIFFLHKYGIQFRNIRDTMLMSQILNAGKSSKGRRFSNSLESIADRYGFPIDKAEQKSDWGWDLTNNQINYAAKDCTIVIELAKLIKTDLVRERLWEKALEECNASPAFAQMSFNGMPVNEAKLDEVIKLYTDAWEKSILFFKEEFPDVNPASPKQVLEALNKNLTKYAEINKIRKKLGGKIKTFPSVIESSNDEVLALFDFPWAESLLSWRSLATQVAYLQGIKDAIYKERVRSKYNQLAPSGQGRSSSTKPNLQNSSNHKPQWKAIGLPAVRSIFEAPKGYKLIVADLSQAHARIAAEASQDPMLIDAYINDWDVHCITASNLALIRGADQTWTPENIKKWCKDKNHKNHELATIWRRSSKNVFYGSLNGQGPRTLINTVQTADDPMEMTLDEARTAIHAWRETYKGLAKFQQNLVTDANNNSIVYDGVEYGITWGLSGRRLFMEKRTSEYYSGKSVKFSDCVAFQWMSTEASIIKEALAMLVDLLDGKAEICNMAHDEIDILVKEEQAEEVATITLQVLDSCMAKYIKSIPINDISDPKKLICNSWADK